MRINLRHIISAVLIIVASVGHGQNFNPDDSVVPESVSKDSKNEVLVIKFSDKNGEEFNAEFKSDKNERLLPSVMRQYLNDQEQQMKQMAEFIRAYLSLPENFYRERLGGQVELHYLMRKLADDFFAIDYFHRLPFDLKNKIRDAYFVKYPDSQVEFFRRYMNLPISSSSERIRAEFSRYPKAYQEEINRLYEWDQKNWAGRFKESFARPISTQMHGFPAQSALFGVAIGAVMMTKMMTDYSENPAALLQYIESLDDPMTHIAFYSFMAASGFTQDYIKSKIGGVGGSKSVRSMRAAIPYIGMSAGMLVSNLTHEIASLMKACSDHLLKPNKPMQPGQVDPCDEAQNEFFSFENKVEMYLPMILSMTISTAGSTYAQKGLMWAGAKGYDYTKKLSEQMAGIHKSSGLPHVEIVQDRIEFNGKKTRWYKNIKPKDMVKIAKNIPGTTKRITGLAMNIALTGRGWSLGPVTVAVTLSAMLAQNYAFVLIDTYLMPAINKVMAQVLRANFLNSADKKLKESVEYHQLFNWSEKAKNCQYTSQARRKMNCEYDIVEDIKRFQKQMNAWRTQNHSRYFMGVQVWGQITNTLLSEIYEAKSFYQFYVNEVFQGFKFQNRLNEKKEIKKVEEPFNTQLQNRMTPFFGIKPLGHPECGKDGNKSEVCVTDLQLYMNYPIEMEGYQKNRIQYVINTFAPRFGLQEKALPFVKEVEKTGIAVFDDEETTQDNSYLKETSPEIDQLLVTPVKPQNTKIIYSILSDLASMNKHKMSQALIRLNQELSKDIETDNGKKALLSKIRELLGQPNPLLVKGAIIPYLYHETRKKAASYTQISRTAYGYYFKNHAEYLMFQMVCGPDIATHSLVEEWNMNLFGRERSLRPPEFHAPKIIKAKHVEVLWPRNMIINGSTKKMDFCKPVVGKPIPFDSIYYAQFFIDGSEKPNSFFDMLNLNIKHEILGSWNSPRIDSETIVANWWEKNIETTMKKLFDRLDYNFQYLLVDLVKGLMPDQQNTWKATNASRSLLQSSIEEMNVYLMILSEVEKSATGYTWVKELNLKHSRSLVESMKKNPIARIASQNDIVSALNLLIKNLQSLEIQMINQHPQVTLGQMDLSQLKTQVDESLKAYKEHLKTVELKEEYAQNTQKATLEALEGNIAALMTYLQNNQLAKYDASEAVEKLLSEENQKGQNKATVKSSSIPMGK